MDSITRKKKRNLENSILKYILKNNIEQDYRLEYIFISLFLSKSKAKIKHLFDIF